MVKSKLFQQYNDVTALFLDRHDLHEEYKGRYANQKIISGEQVHGNQIAYVEKHSETYIKGVDGMITREVMCLDIKTADCLPVFFYIPEIKHIAALHAGWRGLLSGILDNTIKKIISLGENPERMYVYIGPHIRVCCYEVSAYIYKKFENLDWIF